MKRSRLVKIALLALYVAALGLPLQAQSPQAGTSQTQDIDVRLYTLGAFAGSNVYLSYLLLGTAADSYINGVYSDSTAVGIVNEVLYMNENSLSSLASFMAASEFTPEDAQALTKIRGIYQLLSLEGEALIRFISIDNDTGEQFQRYRAQVWTEISSLLGLGN